MHQHQHSKFWLSVHPGQPQKSPDNQNTDAVVRRTTMRKFRGGRKIEEKNKENGRKITQLSMGSKQNRKTR